MAYLYLELLKDSLNEYAYAAELAGLNYDLQNNVYGMYVSIHPPHCLYSASQTFSSQPRSSLGGVSLSQASVDKWSETTFWPKWNGMEFIKHLKLLYITVFCLCCIYYFLYC